MAVLLYHADIAQVPGGFLGVEVFFVVSGFLITTLLLTEHRREGRIDLRSFWVRRARRLLPALVVFFVGLGVIWLASSIKRFVSPLIADTTTTMSCP